MRTRSARDLSRYSEKSFTGLEARTSYESPKTSPLSADSDKRYASTTFRRLRVWQCCDGSGEHSVRTHFIAPGQTYAKRNIESFNGKLRDELLNTHTFTNIFEAARAAETWRPDYNEVRPHSALELLTPREFGSA